MSSQGTSDTGQFVGIKFNKIQISPIHIIPNKKGNQRITQKLFFDSVLQSEHARGDSGEENSLLTGKNLHQNQNQEGWPSALGKKNYKCT